MPNVGRVFSLLSEALGEMYRSYPGLGVMDPTATPPSYSPPFQISINGPSTVGPNNYSCSQWIAVIGQGGQSPYQYDWSGLFTSTDYYVSGTVPQTGGELFLQVTDNNGAQASLWFQITYNPNDQSYCE